MSNHLIYIDQNIIGLHLGGLINLRKNDELIWVYSKEHFSEIKRSNDPERYFKALDDISAVLLDLEVYENWKITDSANLMHQKIQTQLY